MKKYSFNATETLEIASSSDIKVYPSKSGLLEIEVTGSEEAIANIKVEKQGNTATIEDNSSSGSGTQIITSNGTSIIQSFSGGTVINGVSMIGNNIHIGGGSGSVFINGKRINLDDTTATKEDYVPTLITVYTPIVDLSLTLRGVAKFVSTAIFDNVDIDLSGSSEATVNGTDFNVDLSGTSKLTAAIQGGDLKIDTSGCSSAFVRGNVKYVNADSSGTSSIKTDGICLGDYKADASGCSSITHRGSIRGRAKERVSGVASINL